MAGLDMVRVKKKIVFSTAHSNLIHELAFDKLVGWALVIESQLLKQSTMQPCLKQKNFIVSDSPRSYNSEVKLLAGQQSLNHHH